MVTSYLPSTHNGRSASNICYLNRTCSEEEDVFWIVCWHWQSKGKDYNGL